MAAPAATARQSPTGKFLKTGHPTKITNSLDPNIDFWEKEVSGGGVDNGDPIDITTMFNSTEVTKAPQPLNETPDIECVAAYDPISLSQCRSICGVAATITVTHPDGSTEAHYGYLKSAVRDTNTRAEQPTMTVTFVITAWDETNDVEAGPVFVNVAGT